MKKPTFAPSTLMGFLLWALVLATGTVSARNPIPEESGFSGFINAGAIYTDVESNMVAGNKFGDVGNPTVGSIFAKPGSESDVFPLFNADIRYTFASTRTQLFIGNRLEDFVRFDMATQVGVRQGLPDSSSVSVSFVISSFPAEVWADPYVAGVPRAKTDRENIGFRVNWDNLLNTSAGVIYTFRNIDLDSELSGLTQLGLSPAAAALLNREGDHHEAEVYYDWRLRERHILSPAFRYNRFDLDGDAMANDRYSLQLTYAYRGDRFTVVANGVVGRGNYDVVNPIYLTKRQDDIYGGALQLFWHRPFGAPKGLSLLGTLFFQENDTNIDFYDAQTFATGLSAFYRF